MRGAAFGCHRGQDYLSLSQARTGARAAGVAVPIARLTGRRSPAAAAGSVRAGLDLALSVLSHGGVVLLGNAGGNAGVYAFLRGVENRCHFISQRERVVRASSFVSLRLLVNGVRPAAALRFSLSHFHDSL